MPISGNASYGPTTQEFAEHWMAADIELGASGAIALPGRPLGWPTDVNSSTLNALLLDWETKVAEIQSKVNALELNRGSLRLQQEFLLGLFGQFADKVRGSLSGTEWVMALPFAPSVGDSPSRFCAPLDDMEDLWERINQAQAMGVGKVIALQDRRVVPPVPVLLADFVALLTALKGTWRDLTRGELEVKLARGRRDAIQQRIYPILLNYRLVLPTYFGPGTPIGDSLPKLTPEKGSTPEPAVVAGVWDVAKSKAVLSASVPVQQDMKKARLLYSPGTVWDGDASSVVAQVSLVGVNLAEPVVFETDFALSVPGAHALFRVEVENETGNSSQSNIVDVVRP